MIKFIGKNGIILALFAVITTGLIALTHWQTKDRIENAKQSQLLSVLNQLVPSDMYDNSLHSDCAIISPDPLLGNRPQRAFRARKDDTPVAIIVETTSAEGYSGDINLLVAVDMNQMVLGARVVEHKETPGLGDKIETRVSDWIYSFNNLTYNQNVDDRWQVKKDGGQFDQFTGATITPRAVVRAVANAARYINVHRRSIFKLESNCTAPLENVEGVNERI